MPANPFRRYAALVYDALLLIAVVFAATAAYLGVLVAAIDLEGAIPSDSPYSKGLAAWIAVVWVAYFAAFWHRAGYTPGMRTWKLKLVRADGRALRYEDALKRCAAAVLSALPAGLGYWWALWDAEKLTWHDRLSNTLIIRDPDI